MALETMLLLVLAGCNDFFIAPPTATDLLVAPDGGVYIATTDGLLRKSTDQGVHWDVIASFENQGSFPRVLFSLFASPDGTIWAGINSPWRRRSMSIYPTAQVIVSCDTGETFSPLSDHLLGYSPDLTFIPRHEAHPLILFEGSMYQPDDDQECPEFISKFGSPNPVGYAASAAVCGDKIFQAAASRIFSSADEGQTWTLEWDFFRPGDVFLGCDSDDLWAVHFASGAVLRRLADSGEFVELATLGSSFTYGSVAVIRHGLLLVAPSDGKPGIVGFSPNGATYEFPAPDVDGLNEYVLEFDVAPDGVFWLATNVAVYRDDETQTWTSVWP